MALFCSGFERLESEWIFSIYPAGKRLSQSRVSFETAVRSHLLAALIFAADNRFIVVVVVLTLTRIIKSVATVL